MTQHPDPGDPASSAPTSGSAAPAAPTDGDPRSAEPADTAHDDAPAESPAGGDAAGGKRGASGRQLLIAAVVCAVGAGLVMLASGRGWASATVAMPQPLPARHLSLTGADVAPAVNGLGIAGLAGLAGIIATRGIGRIVVGALEKESVA